MHSKGSRIDLHVHSHHSRSAGDRILDKLQINECYTAPTAVYQIAKSRGMNFVTLTDHDTINGALELAHLPDFFISEEISAYFPHDRAKVHILAYGITEAQHADIQKLRFNIYELVPYLRSQGIVHALAHPFFKMGPVLTPEHIEQMLVMFNIFEVKNGGKQLMPENLVELIIQRITPEKINELADKHGLEPFGPTPWLKSRIAGSDDHGGILISTPHTKTETAASSRQLLEHIAAGRCLPIGHGGSPLAVAHGALAVTLQVAKSKRSQFDPIKNELVWKLLENIFEEQTQHGILTLAAALTSARVKKLFKRKKTKNDYKKLFRSIAKDKELQRLLKGKRPFDHEQNIRFFQLISRLTDALLAGMVKASGDGVKMSRLQMLPALLPLLLPYLASFKTENADRPLMRQTALAFLPTELQLPRNAAVFADRLINDPEEWGEVKNVLEEELNVGFDLVHFALLQEGETAPDDVRLTFAPVALLNRQLGFYLPPILQIAFELSEANCELIYVHTFGPMGILGMLLGRLMDIPVIAAFQEGEIKRLIESIGGNSRFFIYFVSLVYSLADQVRLLDYPSAEAKSILQRSNTKVRILSEQVLFEKEKPALAS